MRTARLFITAALFLLSGSLAIAQQLRLGKNPFTVEKSAVLELMSDNQGLLLPRITDTALINVIAPPDGMMIYFTPAKQLLIRAGGYWRSLQTTITTGNLTEAGSGILTITGGTNAVTGSGTTIQVKQASAAQNGFLSSADWSAFNGKLSTIDTGNIAGFYLKTRSLFSAGTGISYNSATGVIASSINTANFWTLGGNTVSTAKNLGTIDNNDLPFITNNTEGMRLSSSGILGIGLTTPNSSTKLDVNGSVKLGAKGSVTKNMMSFAYTTVSTTITAGTASGSVSVLVAGTYPVTTVFAAGITDLTITIPVANQPTGTQGTVRVSPAFDLPGAVSIASARLLSTTQVKIRFLNSSTTVQTIAASQSLYITITEF